MGCRFSCFGQSSSPQTLSGQEGAKHDNCNRSSCSVLSLPMLVSMWKNEAKERELLQEKEQQHNKGKELTLEDWLIASPGLQKMNGSSSRGEYHVFKHHSSKRVFPSFVEENTNGSSSKARRSLKAGEEEEDVGTEDIIEVCSSTGQSGKSKKRVSFRLPEEADIFIFHSSPPEKESQ